MKIISLVLATLFLTSFLNACAAPGEHAAVLGEQSVRRGVIDKIDPVDLEGDHQLGAGTVIGAAAGGIVGNQIGAGHGRDIATVLGVIGGGLAGNAVQNKYVDRRPGQQISVQLENGTSIIVTQLADSNLRVGDHVVVQGQGHDARVVRS